MGSFDHARAFAFTHPQLTESRAVPGTVQHPIRLSGRLPEVYSSPVLTLGLQPYPPKVVRPPKPTPTIFSGGGWSPRVNESPHRIQVDIANHDVAGIFQWFRLKTKDGPRAPGSIAS